MALFDANKRGLMSRLFPREYFFPVQHKALLKQLIRRDIQQRFRGSWLGLGWALITPMAMLAVYTFVFRTVLNARWPGAEDSNTEFALQIFSGLMIFSLFSEIVSRAPLLVVSQPNMVKKVIFPLEVLPWVSAASSFFYTIASLVVLLLAVAVVREGVAVSFLAIPVVLLAFLPLLLGFSWLLAALGVYLRDISHIVGLILTPMLFLSPVFYPVTALPVIVQDLMLLNPLTVIIEAFRACLLDGRWPDFYILAAYGATGVVVAWFGAWCFDKTRKGFADVL